MHNVQLLKISIKGDNQLWEKSKWAAVPSWSSSLTSISIPDSVTKMGYGVFKDWTNEQTIYIQGKSSATNTWDDQWNEYCNAKIVWNA